MHVKKGDNVIVLAGADAGKKGKIIRAFPKENKVLVEGINMKKKHIRANGQGRKGTIVTSERPIHASNVASTAAEPKK